MAYDMVELVLLEETAWVSLVELLAHCELFERLVRAPKLLIKALIQRSLTYLRAKFSVP